MENQRIFLSEKQYPHREICGLCHRVSPIGFWVPDHVWEQVVHVSNANTIHCLSCFTERADEKLVDWSNQIKFYPISLRHHIETLNIKWSHLDFDKPYQHLDKRTMNAILNHLISNGQELEWNDYKAVNFAHVQFVYAERSRVRGLGRKVIIQMEKYLGVNH